MLTNNHSLKLSPSPMSKKATKPVKTKTFKGDTDEISRDRDKLQSCLNNAATLVARLYKNGCRDAVDAAAAHFHKTCKDAYTLQTLLNLTSPLLKGVTDKRFVPSGSSDVPLSSQEPKPAEVPATDNRYLKYSSSNIDSTVRDLVSEQRREHDNLLKKVAKLDYDVYESLRAINKRLDDMTDLFQRLTKSEAVTMDAVNRIRNLEAVVAQPSNMPDQLKLSVTKAPEATGKRLYVVKAVKIGGPDRLKGVLYAKDFSRDTSTRGCDPENAGRWTDDLDKAATTPNWVEAVRANDAWNDSKSTYDKFYEYHVVTVDTVPGYKKSSTDVVNPSEDAMLHAEQLQRGIEPDQVDGESDCHLTSSGLTRKSVERFTADSALYLKHRGIPPDSEVGIVIRFRGPSDTKWSYLGGGFNHADDLCDACLYTLDRAEDVEAHMESIRTGLILPSLTNREDLTIQACHAAVTKPARYKVIEPA